MKSPFSLQLLIVVFLLVALMFSSSFIKATSWEPCSDMTLTSPLCKYGLFKNVDKLIKTFDGNSSFVEVISENSEKHYMLIKTQLPSLNSSKITIQGNVRSGGGFDSFLDVSFKDDCGGYPIEGESITFLNSNADILLTGWFVAQKPVCIGNFQLFSQPLASFKNVPFMAVISSAGVVQSVTTLNIGYTIESVFIEKSTGKRYIIMKKDSQIYLVIYQDKVLLKKQIAGCEDPTKCKVLSVHYSSIYDRIVVSFFETQEFQLIINGDNKDYLPHQSALWVLLLNPVDGSYIHSQVIFHSTSVVIPTPKIKFDSIGKLNILLTCDTDCYLNNNGIAPNVFLLQYDYIKTTFSLTKNFIKITGGVTFNQDYFKIHSLSLERDDTISTVITGKSAPYLIVDSNSRSMQASNNSVYQYRFRHVDGKIIHVQKLTSEYDITSDFVISTSSSLVNSNRFVAEQNPIIYIRNPASDSKELKAVSYNTYGNRFNDGYTWVRNGGTFGGGGGKYYSGTDGRIKSIKIIYSSGYVYGLLVTNTNGNSVQMGDYGYSETSFTFADDEYVTEIHHEYKGYGFIFQSTTLACLRFFTNKGKNYGVYNCWGGSVEYVPQDVELIGFVTKSANVIDSIYYNYGYANTYACASGYTGDNCDVPICFDLEATNPNVCNRNGKCTGPNTCVCSSDISPIDSHTCLPYGFCEDLSTYNSGSCNGRGTCYYNSTCSCDRGYYGDYCEIEAKCYGISKSSYGVCSNHGKCVDTDLCECSSGYVGNNCELPICYGKVSNESDACSGHGSCLKVNTCSCKTGYYGNNCQLFSCNGTDSSQPTACSSKGKCVDYNTCNCTEGFFGSNCEQFTCNGTANLDPTVCSGNGICSTIDTCLCRGRSYGNFCEICENGYFGDHCEKWTCGGVENSSPNVCNSRGVCKSFDNCHCESENIKGQFCESCITGYFGEKCNNWTCGGVLNSDPSVCNFRGICKSFEKCECNTRSNGTTCENCLGFYEGQTCGSCVSSHFGDECENFIESNKAPYMEDFSNGVVYGFRVTTNTNFRYVLDTVDCSKVFQNLNELAEPNASLFCRVKEIGLNLDKKSYRYNVELYTRRDYARFSPRTPILFNVMWSSNKNASYELVNLDISDFLKTQQPTYDGISVMTTGILSSTSINRCFETLIITNYEQPEPGSFQNMTWELTGNSANLMSNKLVKEALESAQNNIRWTFPYIPEMLKYSSIEMSVSVITNFGLTLTNNLSFPIGGSYPRSPITFPTRKIVMTSTQTSIPLTQFFLENQECIDLRTISYDLSLNYPSYYLKVEISEKSFTIKPQTFSENLKFQLNLKDGTKLPFQLQMIPPTVLIKESVVVYKQSEIPSITLSCKNNYGTDNLHTPFVFLIRENNNILRKTVPAEEATATVSIPVNQLYPDFNLTIDHTFTAACLQSTYYTMSSVSELMSLITTSSNQDIAIGKSTQLVSFIPDTRVDVSSCNVLSATLTGMKVNNVIPSLEESMTYFLDILTSQASNCQVNIKFISSQFEKYPLDFVSVSGTRFLLPLQYYNGKLKSKFTTIPNVGKYFTLSLMGTSDVSDIVVPITVQDSLSETIKISDCTISPPKLEIGFTIGKLACTMENPLSSISMTLMHEDSVVGTSLSFPITFKTTKSSSNFKILISDTKTGGKLTMPIKLTNNIEFSTTSLFTSDVVSSISTTLTNSTTDFYKSNDLVISLVSNINIVSQNNSVISEISKIIPLALSATATSLSTQLDTNLAKGSITSEDMSNYMNQVKVLSKPQFLTDETVSKTVDMLNKFVDVSSKAVVWSSDSSNSLSEILVNVASKIPEQSTIKLASSIVNAAISLGTKTELTTADFFPTEKPSNLVSINAVKTSITTLNSNTFSFSNSTISLVSFSVSITSETQLVNVANSLFKFPTALSRKVQDVKKEYVSQLTISSSVSGNVHINVPIPSYTAPTSSNIKQTFRCSLTLDFVNFDTESKCKSVSTSQALLTDIKPTEQTLIVDCLCDLSSLSNLMNNSMVGITADYIEEAVDNNNYRYTGSDSSGAGAVILIPIFICCGCFITIPAIVTAIIVREKRKKENNSTTNQQETNKTARPPYDRVITSSTLQSNSSNNSMNDVRQNAFGHQYGMTNTPTIDQRQPYSVAMKTFSTFDVIDVQFDNPTTI